MSADTLTLQKFPRNYLLNGELLRGSFSSSRISAFSTALSIAAPSTASLCFRSSHSLRYFSSLPSRVSTSSSMSFASSSLKSELLFFYFVNIVTNLALYLQGLLQSSGECYKDINSFASWVSNHWSSKPGINSTWSKSCEKVSPSPSQHRR